LLIQCCRVTIFTQAVQKGLASLGRPGSAEAAADALRLVDTYIKVRGVNS
jgi:hypothetical protein